MDARSNARKSYAAIETCTRGYYSYYPRVLESGFSFLRTGWYQAFLPRQTCHLEGEKHRAGPECDVFSQSPSHNATLLIPSPGYSVPDIERAAWWQLTDYSRYVTAAMAMEADSYPSAPSDCISNQITEFYMPVLWTCVTQQGALLPTEGFPGPGSSYMDFLDCSASDPTLVVDDDKQQLLQATNIAKVIAYRMRMEDSLHDIRGVGNVDSSRARR
ncbi:hypothetical protein B0T22DRAFT_445240 [Podospora appendiculata]|uniref:Uncharacterized protein n=1 Tax=Podospora appendiculata TaxID=314037 RepID=A0AAE0WZL6_9PEZI|nr:hypothetical protein B0T22DRAFT_445240 [Podospora appendiculata]